MTTPPLSGMQKIAEILEDPLTDLLDEYNLLLYHGQGKQIHHLRKSMDLTQNDAYTECTVTPL